MMIAIARNSTDVSLELFAVDAVTGLPRTGLAAGDVDAAYVRTRSQSVVLALSALAGPAAAHADGGFVEIDAAGLPGWYRLDLPDAAFAAGAEVVTTVAQATNVWFTPLRVQLVESFAALSDEVHLCKAALVNARVHTVSTGVDEIKDDDGVTTLVTLTPEDGGEDVIIVTPS